MLFDAAVWSEAGKAQDRVHFGYAKESWLEFARVHRRRADDADERASPRPTIYCEMTKTTIEDAIAGIEGFAAAARHVLLGLPVDAAPHNPTVRRR
ncbi:hypothetical protein [Bradyrhizobium sp. I71]|uniref:hypothetical protein n=1 Tax=Bradyrhizobium sp. I71 TaxID=2590772 RepID=UPI001EF95A6B|nr:hypothetical protein [Bradyrhizobium sp. I71]ULK97945.1 hypothetical protein FJV43_35605 [Bradyrhizobium sp. I71]